MIYSNFHTQLWYTPISERSSDTPTRFLLKTLPYTLYTQMTVSQDLIDGISTANINDNILNYIIDVENLIGYTKGALLSEILPLDLQNELIKVLVDLFIPSKSFLDKLNITLDVVVNPKFDSSWDCEVCQSRRLDKQRNCPYLDVKEYHEPSFRIQVLGENVNVCPINLKDNRIASTASEARSIRESGYLPEAGALGDQSVYFVIVSQKINSVIKYYENKMIENSKSG